MIVLAFVFCMRRLSRQHRQKDKERQKSDIRG